MLILPDAQIIGPLWQVPEEYDLDLTHTLNPLINTLGVKIN